MFFKQATRKIFILITAFAVFWVFLGALINFHANRILGTELIDHAFPAIKPKTKENTFQLADLSKNFIQLDLFTPQNNIDLADPLLQAALVKKQEFAVSIFVVESSHQFGLRAPPVI